MPRNFHMPVNLAVCLLLQSSRFTVFYCFCNSTTIVFIRRFDHFYQLALFGFLVRRRLLFHSIATTHRLTFRRRGRHQDCLSSSSSSNITAIFARSLSSLLPTVRMTKPLQNPGKRDNRQRRSSGTFAKSLLVLPCC